jgi:hypothetical protein
MPFTFWNGPIVGQSVSHIWQGYAAVLFLEFGKLSPPEYTLPNGRPGQPRGEFGLTTMEGGAAWKLLVRTKEITTSDALYDDINRYLRRLVGRRLQTFAIDAASLSTRLIFSNGLVLTTSTLDEPLQPPSHWLMRLPSSGSNDWPSVVLGGTRTTRHWRNPWP